MPFEIKKVYWWLFTLSYSTNLFLLIREFGNYYCFWISFHTLGSLSVIVFRAETCNKMLYRCKPGFVYKSLFGWNRSRWLFLDSGTVWISNCDIPQNSQKWKKKKQVIHHSNSLFHHDQCWIVLVTQSPRSLGFLVDDEMNEQTWILYQSICNVQTSIFRKIKKKRVKKIHLHE